MTTFILKNIVQITIGIVFTLFGILYKQFMKYLKRVKIAEKALINLLKIEILELYEKIQDRTCINVYELDKIEQLYKEYIYLESNESLEYIMKYINEIKIQENCKIV